MKRLLLAVGCMPLLTGCSLLTGLDAEPCSSDPGRRPVRVATEPVVVEVPENESNIDLHVTSTLAEPVRVTVRLGGRRALDIEIPGTPQGCSHQPVYRYGYRLPAGRVTVTATTDQGQRDTTTLDLAADRRWVVVQVQDGFPLHLSRWDEEPMWG